MILYFRSLWFTHTHLPKIWKTKIIHICGKILPPKNASSSQPLTCNAFGHVGILCWCKNYVNRRTLPKVKPRELEKSVKVLWKSCSDSSSTGLLDWPVADLQPWRPLLRGDVAGFSGLQGLSWASLSCLGQRHSMRTVIPAPALFVDMLTAGCQEHVVR